MKERKSNATVITISLVVFGAVLVYVREQLGDTAALCFLFYVLGIATGIVCIALGGRMNDQGQHAFIQGMGQLKTILAPTFREAAKTQGAYDRAAIGRQPTPDEVDLETFYQQREHLM